MENTIINGMKNIIRVTTDNKKGCLKHQNLVFE